MRIEKRKRVARALLAALIAAGQPMSVAAANAAARGDEVDVAGSVLADPGLVPAIAGTLEAAMPATAAGCPASVSCGEGCVAQLSTGFCVLAVKWTGGVSIGSFQIGPTVSAECHICECWYTYTNSSGNKIFKRTTDFGCGASVGDLHVV